MTKVSLLPFTGSATLSSSSCMIFVACSVIFDHAFHTVDEVADSPLPEHKRQYHREERAYKNVPSSPHIVPQSDECALCDFGMSLVGSCSELSFTAPGSPLCGSSVTSSADCDVVMLRAGIGSSSKSSAGIDTRSVNACACIHSQSLPCEECSSTHLLLQHIRGRFADITRIARHCVSELV